MWIGNSLRVVEQFAHIRYVPLANTVSDTNDNETLVFTKLSGPAWLAVSANGVLSGTPAANNLGTNTFAVRVADSAGFVDEAALRVTVSAPAPPVIGAGVKVAGGEFGFEFTGTPGLHYRVEFSPVLPAPGAWQVVDDLPALEETPFRVRSPATNSAGFFRVQWIP